MTKQDQQLKKNLKATAKTIKEKGCPDYINLSTASIERLQQYIDTNKNWSPRLEIEEEEEEEKIIPHDFSAINSAKKLSELGKAIASLSGTGNWAKWQMSFWCKNGECRVYMRDCSYTNPKDRGYYLIKEDGTCFTVINQSNCSFPNLPPLPAVENDLAPVSSSKLSPVAKATANLDAQFGRGGWTQADLDDELERDEYQ